MKNTLYVVIPCYNEQEVLPETTRRLKSKMLFLMEQNKISKESRVVLVNDGSKDHTWKMICEFHENDSLFTGINLSRNRGHQNALLAGLMTVMDDADMVISMDADLQDDINAMDEMVDKYLDGCDIVYGVRSKRATDTFFKRFTAEGFYHLMNLMGADIVFNHADYRLMSRRALHGLAQFKEVNLFLRGLIPMIGYRTDYVMFERNERFAGESKYPLKKMLALAMDGITSLSVKPIRIITATGILLALVGIVLLIWLIVKACLGTASLAFGIMASLWFLVGLLMVSVGIVGEYIGKIYMETKARPRFIIQEYLESKKTDKDV